MLRERDTVWELEQFETGGMRFIGIKEDMIETIDDFIQNNAELIHYQDEE